MDPEYSQQYAELYRSHWWWRAREGFILRQLDALAPDEGWSRILDVGCGDGRTARYIARSATSVIGLDPDAERIALARGTDDEKSSCPVAYRCEDAVTMDFPVAFFDAVIFTRSL